MSAAEHAELLPEWHRVADLDELADGRVKTVQAGHRTLALTHCDGRYGALDMQGDTVHSFQEKPAGDGAWINGGYFVLEPSVFDYIDGDQTSWESQPLQQLASQAQLVAYQHGGFWQAMDTLRDVRALTALWESGAPPWVKTSPSKRTLSWPASGSSVGAPALLP